MITQKYCPGLAGTKFCRQEREGRGKKREGEKEKVKEKKEKERRKKRGRKKEKEVNVTLKKMQNAKKYCKMMTVSWKIVKKFSNIDMM